MLLRVSIKGSPHMLRRGYGTALALQGCDAHTLMRLMRHRNIKEAIPYINMTDQHLAQHQKEFSPLDFARTGNKRGFCYIRISEEAEVGHIVAGQGKILVKERGG